MSLAAHGLVSSWETLPLRLLGLAHLIAEHHNRDTGECFPSIGYLARRGESSERTVQKLIKELEDRGVLERVPTYDAAGRQTSNRYRFLSFSSGGGVTSDGGEGVTSFTPNIKQEELNKPPSGGVPRDPCVSPSPPTAKPKRRVNGVPYSQIRELWAEILPQNPQPLPSENWTDARKATIRARWGDQLPSLQHWRDTFEMIGESRFLTGRQHNPNRKPFRATLWWISKPDNLSRLYEGEFSD